VTFRYNGIHDDENKKVINNFSILIGYLEKLKGVFKKMKKKYYFVILFLVLAIFLSGCSGGGIITPATDEAKIKSVVYEYFLATNDQNWDKAKSYCVYGSEEYYDLCFFEDTINTYSQSTSNITITCDADIYNTSITGNYATVYLEVKYLITVNNNVVMNDNVLGYYYLEKISNNWKIYLSAVS
jgi:hypothetical protein